MIREKEGIARLPGFTAEAAPLPALRPWDVGAPALTPDRDAIVPQSCNLADFIPCFPQLQVCFLTACWWTRLPFVPRTACTTCMTACMVATSPPWCWACPAPGGPCAFGPPCVSTC